MNDYEFKFSMIVWVCDILSGESDFLGVNRFGV